VGKGVGKRRAEWTELVWDIGERGEWKEWGGGSAQSFRISPTVRVAISAVRKPSMAGGVLGTTNAPPLGWPSRLRSSANPQTRNSMRGHCAPNGNRCQAARFHRFEAGRSSPAEFWPDAGQKAHAMRQEAPAQNFRVANLSCLAHPVVRNRQAIRKRLASSRVPSVGSGRPVHVPPM
jgi:hypothetical protein